MTKKDELIAEAIGKGFGIAKKWVSPKGSTCYNHNPTIEWDYFKETDTLFLNFGVVYRQGIWGEVKETHK